MASRNESNFAELIFDRLILESFPSESSAYHQDNQEKELKKRLQKIRSKVRWHIDRSLSKRQKEVLKLLLMGKKEREIAEILKSWITSRKFLLGEPQFTLPVN